MGEVSRYSAHVAVGRSAKKTEGGLKADLRERRPHQALFYTQTSSLSLKIVLFPHALVLLFFSHTCWACRRLSSARPRPSRARPWPASRPALACSSNSRCSSRAAASGCRCA